MSKIIFVSNRLPITIEQSDSGLVFKPSIGGLATGLGSVHQSEESLWVGWCGLPSEKLSVGEKKELEERLPEEHGSIPVFLSDDEMKHYYYGFCNRTVWPLFHYFNNYTDYNHENWNYYRNVNNKFFLELSNIIDEQDTIWVHDYQLMLLPALIREKFPKVKIGFFLHIPFPSYEIFRLLPWRSEILYGMLGADLIGFHTYDYVRHFLSSVRRLLGYEHNLGYINMGNRLVKGDVFPMGIDYKRYEQAHELEEVQKNTREVQKNTRGVQLVLSVDRLDYTKGIPERIKAFSRFLRENPRYREKVTMILIVAPSRVKVNTYHELLKDIEELVSNTNGEHGTIGWVPIWFFFRSFGFEYLNALYSLADVMLVTPLRDGMNLVAKEYVASKIDNRGMLVLSETAGAASELGESVIVNANNIHEVAEGVKRALEMTTEEKITRNQVMHQRLAHYNVEFWAQDFLRKLATVEERQRISPARKVDTVAEDRIMKSAMQVERRLFLLDYDNALMGFVNKPVNALPTKELLQYLRYLAADSRNEILIVSGQDRRDLDDWFGDLKINLIAAHGLWLRERDGEWERPEVVSDEWKETVRPMLEMHTERTPGAYVKEKDHSLAWLYERCEPELAAVRVRELKDTLEDLTANLNLGLINGNKMIEIKDTTMNKGRAAARWLVEKEWDFIFAVGDDWTDEELFSLLPENAFSIKIGIGMSHANYRVESVTEVRKLLKKLVSVCSEK